MILPNIGGSTDEVVITHETSILVSNFNLGVIHEAKSDAVILNTQPYIGRLKHIFFWGGEGVDKAIQYKSFSVCLGITINDKLSWAKHIRVQSVIQSFSSKVKMLRCLENYKESTALRFTLMICFHVFQNCTSLLVFSQW